MYRNPHSSEINYEWKMKVISALYSWTIHKITNRERNSESFKSRWKVSRLLNFSQIDIHNVHTAKFRSWLKAIPVSLLPITAQTSRWPLKRQAKSHKIYCFLWDFACILRAQRLVCAVMLLPIYAKYSTLLINRMKSDHDTEFTFNLFV